MISNHSSVSRSHGTAGSEAFPGIADPVKNIPEVVPIQSQVWGYLMNRNEFPWYRNGQLLQTHRQRILLPEDDRLLHNPS